MTHLVAGYPDKETSEQILNLLCKYSRYVEVQIPFNDPIADGTIISDANNVAIGNNMDLEWVFQLVNRRHKNTDCEILIMTYYHRVYTYGRDAFLDLCKQSWVIWCIIPDIPFDTIDGEHLLLEMKKRDLALIPVIAPSTPSRRIKDMIGNTKSPFLYAISTNAITWSNVNFERNVHIYTNKIREVYKGKIGVGFGVKTIADIIHIRNSGAFPILWSVLITIFQQSWLIWLEKFLQEITPV
mgnify:FL=1